MREHFLNFVSKNRKRIIFSYRALLIVLFCSVISYIFFADIFVSDMGDGTTLNLFSLLLSPMGAVFGSLKNYKLILPAMIVLLPCLIMVSLNFYAGFRGLFDKASAYYPYDEFHCSTHNRPKYISTNLVWFVLSVLISTVINTMDYAGVENRYFAFPTVTLVASLVFYILYFCTFYVLNDAIAKQTLLANDTLTEFHDAPFIKDERPIYVPKHIVKKQKTFYWYMSTLLVLCIVAIIVLCFFPLFKIQKYGVLIDECSAANYIMNYEKHLSSAIVSSQNWIEQIIAEAHNFLEPIIAFLTLLFFTFETAYALPFLAVSLMFGITIRDIKTIKKRSGFCLIMSAILWILVVSKVIYDYSMEVSEGILATLPLLFIAIISLVSYVVSCVLPKAFSYLSEKSEYEAVKTGTEFDDKCCFIGPQACDYYLHAFYYGMYWNWSAFLFGRLWLAYRKVYKLLFTEMMIEFSLVLFLLIDYEGDPRRYLWIAIIKLAMNVFDGLFGNAFYHFRCTNVISDSIKRPPYDNVAFLCKKGGTSGFNIAWTVLLNIAFYTTVTLVYILN